jgi:hypothetical protein
MAPTEAEKAAYAAKHYKTTETDVETKACQYARRQGCWVAKFKSPNNRGAPDRLFITPDGVVFFIEFKAPDVKKPRVQQKLVIDEMRERRAKVYVTNNLEVAKSIISDLVTFGICNA